MGADNLQERTNGQTVNSEWYNLIHRVLQGDLLPRNSSGVVTDIAGNLGSAAYRWLSAYVKNLKLVSDSSNTVTISAPTALSAPYDLTLPEALPVSTKALVVNSDGTMAFGSYTSQKGSVGSTVDSTTTTWQTIATLSSFASSGRPLLLFAMSGGNFGGTDYGYIGAQASSSADTSCYVLARVMRDGTTEVGAVRFGATIPSGGASALTLQLPGSMVFFDENPGVGTHTYTLQARPETSGDHIIAGYISLLGMEW